MTPPRGPNEPSLGHRFVVGALQVDLRLPQCQSLKEKRGVLARTMTRLRTSCPVAVAEVGNQDLWGRAALAAVTVSGDRAVAERVLHSAVELLERIREIELVDYEIEIL